MSSDPVVVGLFVASATGEPMQLQDAVEVVPGVGIPGDRYATGRGHWSDPRWPDQELTLVEAELAEELGVGPGDLRRNVVTRGIDLQNVIGRTFWIGTATLQGVRVCDPCRHVQSLTRPGLLADLTGRGGVRVAVTGGGTIACGDLLRLV